MENKKFDVGIVGYWYATNYGSALTYYALSEAIKKIGYTAVLIDRPEKETDPEGEDVFPRNFLKNRCNISESVRNGELGKLSDLCDTFIIGSDQVWTKDAIRRFDYMFVLSFVDDSKNKIAYAPSFGNARFDVSEDVKAKVYHYLHRFNNISVREDTGKQLLKKDYDIDATHILDPVFLLDAADYLPIAQDSRTKTSGDYILAYILDPTEDIELYLKNVSNKLKMNIKIILDGRKGTFENNKSKFTIYDKEILSDVDVTDWVKLFLDAKYVLTDSHHGLAMAIIFNKNFICYANYRRGYTRFTSLLTKVGLLHRMINNSSEVTDELLYDNIDYAKVKERFQVEIEQSKNWLKNALKKNDKTYARLKEASVEGLPVQKCMGCGACASICPTNAITMRSDALGYYRRTVNYAKCTLCGLCEKICPAIKLPKKDTLSKPQLYACVGADKDLLDASSSGGAFSLLAKQVLRKKGYVFGAAWREDFSIAHIMIDNEQDLSKLQKSKYMQSYTGDIFRTVREKLKESKPVLFCGCPCQIAGLKAYLGKPYDNLLLVDFLCANAPSTMFFQKYLKESFGNDIKAYEFRDKSQGWSCDSVKITDAQNNIIKKRGAAQDMYQSVFHNHTMCPPHCENCQYQSIPRYGDLTIGDFWGIQKVDPSIDASKGVSALLVNNEKGRYYFDNIPSKDIRIAKEEPLDYLGGNGFAVKGRNWVSPYRNIFYQHIRDKSFAETLAIIDQAKSAPTVSLPQNILPQEATIPLSFFSSRTRFEFDPSCFEEHNLNDYTVLTVKSGKDKVGIRAFLPLNQTLDTSKTYEIAARFKIRSNTKDINFHIYSDSGKFQVVKSVVFGTNKDFIAFKQPFKPTVANCTKFMIGACHITGPEAFFLIDYITIREI